MEAEKDNDIAGKWLYKLPSYIGTYILELIVNERVPLWLNWK